MLQYGRGAKEPRSTEVSAPPRNSWGAGQMGISRCPQGLLSTGAALPRPCLFQPLHGHATAPLHLSTCLGSQGHPGEPALPCPAEEHPRSDYCSEARLVWRRNWLSRAALPDGILCPALSPRGCPRPGLPASPDSSHGDTDRWGHHRTLSLWEGTSDTALVSAVSRGHRLPHCSQLLRCQSGSASGSTG